MAHGLFRLWVCPPGQEWGLLETKGFDDNKRRKAQHRQHVLGSMQSALIGWMYNYHAYTHAAFCIEEQESDYQPPMHVLGVPRKGSKRGGGLKRLIPKALQQKLEKQKRKQHDKRLSGKAKAPTGTGPKRARGSGRQVKGRLVGHRKR